MGLELLRECLSADEDRRASRRGADGAVLLADDDARRRLRQALERGSPSGSVKSTESALQLPQLVPERAANPRNWLEQRVEVEALVDDHLAAAGTPVGLDARRFGTVFQLSGGILRVRR